MITMTAPLLTGYKSYTVLSDSMSRTINYGSIVYVEKASFADMKPGDIATFESGKDQTKHFTHRIVSIDKQKKSFITKGDANPTNDPVPVSADRLVGKVVYIIPYAGLPAALFENTTAVIITVILLALWMATEIELAISKRKTRKNTP